MKKVILTILSIKQNSVRTINEATRTIVEYPRSFLKKRFEMGVFEVTNPEKLYQSPVAFI